MGTHALFIVQDEHGDGDVFIFKHSDGYPSQAAYTLRDTFRFSWKLPRYEASEFAAAIATAIKVEYLLKELDAYRRGDETAAKGYAMYNRDMGGCARIFSDRDTVSVDYEYVIKMVDRKLMINVNDGEFIPIEEFINQNVK